MYIHLYLLSSFPSKFLKGGGKNFLSRSWGKGVYTVVMASWYYVIGRERNGPVAKQEIEKLYRFGTLNEDSHVWREGFSNWEKLNKTEDFAPLFAAHGLPPELDIPELPGMGEPAPKEPWDNLDPDEKTIHIKVGYDRGGEEVEYGPYSINQLKRAYKERRINDKSYIFIPGMQNWVLLGDSPLFSQLSSAPVTLTEQDRRKSVRRPVTANIIFHNNQKVFDGICRDISIGGMQVLVGNFSARIGEGVTLNVHPDNSSHSFTAKGKIVRLLDGGQGFSLRFSELDQQAKESLLSYIDQS